MLLFSFPLSWKSWTEVRYQHVEEVDEVSSVWFSLSLPIPSQEVKWLKQIFFQNTVVTEKNQRKDYCIICLGFGARLKHNFFFCRAQRALGTLKYLREEKLPFLMVVIRTLNHLRFWWWFYPAIKVSWAYFNWNNLWLDQMKEKGHPLVIQ